MNRTCKSLAVALGALALAGCVSPQGLRPQAQPLHAAQLATGSAFAGVPQHAPWPAAQWWRSLHDPQLDFVKMAQGMGVDASRAETVEQFAAQFADAMQRKGPRLIEAVLQP